MTVKDKYQENEDLIQRYTDFLLNHNYYAYDQNYSRVKKVTRDSENKLIDEIAKLRKQNRDIRVASIVTPNYLNEEYNEYTVEISSEINSTRFYAPYPKPIGRFTNDLELL